MVADAGLVDQIQEDEATEVGGEFLILVEEPSSSPAGGRPVVRALELS